MNRDPADLQQSDSPPRHRRTVLVRGLMCFAFAFLTLQLWRLQIVEGVVHRAAADDNSLRPVTIPALRGVIYDRNLTPLAVNAPMFAVTITEADVPVARRSQIVRQTAAVLGIAPEEIEQALKFKTRGEQPFAPVTIKENVPREVALALEERSWQLPGVSVRVGTIRQYTDGPTFAHVLGYMALPRPEEYTHRYKLEGYDPSERVGTTGVEQVYESELHGRPGGRVVEVDVAGRPVRQLDEQPPESGRRLVLSLDGELQRTAYEALNSRLETIGSGVAVVMDPRNGEVLSLVSVPSYDDNVFALPNQDAEISGLLADPKLPLFDRALAGQYPPGSTFKLVTGIGALEEGVANRNTRIDCNGGLRIPNPYNPSLSTFLPDWGIMGVLDFVQGLAQSCNVYFYTLGGGFGPIDGLKVERLGRYARMVGYGQPTGIDLPSEAIGRVPSPAWKQAALGDEWVPGDTYHMSIGQGAVLATPVQVASLTNALATGGTFYRPHVVRSIVDSDGRVVREVGAEITRKVALKPETLAAMKDGMMAVMETPQARPYNNLGIRVAGKTGTAEYAAPKDGSAIGPTHGWFTAYAPAEDPRVSVTVFVEHGGGPTDALPLAIDIMRAYFARYP